MPATIDRETNACLKSCLRKFVILFARHAVVKDRLTSFSPPKIRFPLPFSFNRASSSVTLRVIGIDRGRAHRHSQAEPVTRGEDRHTQQLRAGALALGQAVGSYQREGLWAQQRQTIDCPRAYEHPSEGAPVAQVRPEPRSAAHV